MIHAIGISESRNHALSGLNKSMMRAAGYGFGSQSGVIATLIAQSGFTGPTAIIEIFNEAIGDNMNLTPVIKGGDRMKILDTSIKPFASEHMIHSPLEALF